MWAWVQENQEWLFSGAGLWLLLNIKHVFRWVRIFKTSDPTLQVSSTPHIRTNTSCTGIIFRLAATCGAAVILTGIVYFMANAGFFRSLTNSAGRVECLLGDCTTPLVNSSGYWNERDPEKNKVIVFVHGFTGNVTDTWTNEYTGAYWPELLMKDPEKSFEEFNIYLFGYSTEIQNPGRKDISDIAGKLRRDLNADGVTEHQEIIFLVHSLGGITVRNYLINRLDADKLRSKISFIYFFASPTGGSQIAKLGSALFDNNVLNELSADSDFLDLQKTSWRNIASDITSYCAYELRETHGVIVVGKDEASQLCLERLDSIDTNHVDIVKPRNHGDDRYKAFKGAFREVYPPNPAVPTPTKLPFAPQAEDEVLIVIATFDVSEGTSDRKVHKLIGKEIQHKIDQLGFVKLRVEVEPTIIEPSIAEQDQAAAKDLAQIYNASMVIWGEDTDAFVNIKYLNLQKKEFPFKKYEWTETERARISDESGYHQFITKDLPAQLSFFALFPVAHSYLAANDTSNALIVLEMALNSLSDADAELPDKMEDAYFTLGWLLQVNNNFDRAIELYTKALELEKRFSEAYYNRAIVHKTIGDLDAAIDDYGMAIANFQDNFNVASSYRNRSFLNLCRKDYQLAINDLEQALLLYDNKSDKTLALNYLGYLYAIQGNWESAVSYFRLATESDSAHLNASNNYCWYSSLQGNSHDALNECERLVEIATLENSEDPYSDVRLYRDSRGLARSLTGDYTGALEDFEAFVDWSKNNGVFDQLGRKRTEWISELRENRNPFTVDTLNYLVEESNALILEAIHNQWCVVYGDMGIATPE